MLVADSSLNNIYQVDLINGSTQSFFASPSANTNPIAVAYDPTTNDVYYTNFGQPRAIMKYSLISKIFVTVYEDVNGK